MHLCLDDIDVHVHATEQGRAITSAPTIHTQAPSIYALTPVNDVTTYDTPTSIITTNANTVNSLVDHVGHRPHVSSKEAG